MNSLQVGQLSLSGRTLSVNPEQKEVLQKYLWKEGRKEER